MSLKKIVKAPNAILRKSSKPVKNIDESVKNLIQDMLDTMYNASGIGLAAVQVGILSRIVVIDTSKDDNKKNPIVFINPKIINKSKKTVINEEGCLSIPGYYGEVERHDTCKIQYEDISGLKKTIDADGILSRCIQHEIDHCNGVLFIDHLSKLKRDIIEKKLKKNTK